MSGRVVNTLNISDRLFLEMMYARFNVYTRYYECMGRNSIGVSGFALTVSKAIRAQLGMRRMSGRDLAKAIGRGQTYVRDRINDDKEWALGDLERMCDLWHLTPRQLIESVPDVASDGVVGRGGGDPVAEEEERKRALVMAKLHRGDVHLAAYEDPHKLDPDVDE